LLAMTLNSAPGPSSSNTYYYHSEGNGNVTMMVNPWQYIVAKYLYDAFGNVLSASGVMAQQNLYRFSSKEAHPNSGLVYYLYRYYDPNLQRWPNRDPIQELGGFNLYKYIGNNPVDGIDAYGSDGGVLSLPVTVIAVASEAPAYPVVIAVIVAATDVAGAAVATTAVAAMPVAVAIAIASQPPSPVNYPGDGSGNQIPIQITGPLIIATTATWNGQATDKHGNKLGPSGKPVRHNPECPTQKEAKDTARQQGKGTPVKHDDHYHPSGPDGDKAPGSPHYHFPK